MHSLSPHSHPGRTARQRRSHGHSHGGGSCHPESAFSWSWGHLPTGLTNSSTGCHLTWVLFFQWHSWVQTVAQGRRKTPSGRPNSFWLPQRDRGLLKPPGSIPSVSIQSRCCRTKCGVPLAPWAHTLWAAPLPPWGVLPRSHTCYVFVL